MTVYEIKKVMTDTTYIHIKSLDYIDAEENKRN
jgi:hypothetical protein